MGREVSETARKYNAEGAFAAFAVAACRGPKGDCETRKGSDRNGNLSFQQFFPDHKNMAGIFNDRVWQLDETGRTGWISAIETSISRGHEFPLLALDLRRRFHDFKVMDREQFEDQAAIRVAVTTSDIPQKTISRRVPACRSRSFGGQPALHFSRRRGREFQFAAAKVPEPRLAERLAHARSHQRTWRAGLPWLVHQI